MCMAETDLEILGLWETKQQDLILKPNLRLKASQLAVVCFSMSRILSVEGVTLNSSLIGRPGIHTIFPPERKTGSTLRSA